MRILFTIGALGCGGAERVVLLLANSLCEKKHEVGILTVYGSETVYEVNPKVEHISIDPLCDNKYINFIHSFMGIRKRIRKYAPDIVISFLADINSMVLTATRCMRCKVIISERNDPHIDPTINAFRVLRRMVYPFADGYVFQTPDARKYFSKVIGGKKSIIIPNPITDNMPIHKNNDSKTIVASCRLAKQKNIPMLIDAFEIIYHKYSEYRLDIYGQGELREDIQTYIADKKLTSCISLKGFHEDVWDQMNAAEMFVITSNYEGMSNSMMEALAMGIPTIATDCPIGGARMLIKNGENGILVPVGDVNKLAEAMSILIENRDLREKMGLNALEIRETNSLETILEKWIGFVEDVLG